METPEKSTQTFMQPFCFTEITRNSSYLLCQVLEYLLTRADRAGFIPYGWSNISFVVVTQYNDLDFDPGHQGCSHIVLTVKFRHFQFSLSHGDFELCI